MPADDLFFQHLLFRLTELADRRVELTHQFVGFVCDAKQAIRITVAVVEAARDAAVNRDNPDTCGVCGLHFHECEQDVEVVGDEPRPACAGARIRIALR